MDSEIDAQLAELKPWPEVAFGEDGFLRATSTGEVHFRGRHIGTSAQVFRACDALRLDVELMPLTAATPGSAEVYEHDDTGTVLECLYSPQIGEIDEFGNPAFEAAFRLVVTRDGAAWVCEDTGEEIALSDEELFAALEGWAEITQN